MNFEHLKGKQATVKSTGQVGVIKDVSVRFNGQRIRTARYIIDDVNGIPIEYMPHEVELTDEDRDSILKERNTVAEHPQSITKYPLTQSDVTE